VIATAAAIATADFVIVSILIAGENVIIMLLLLLLLIGCTSIFLLLLSHPCHELISLAIMRVALIIAVLLVIAQWIKKKTGNLSDDGNDNPQLDDGSSHLDIIISILLLLLLLLLLTIDIINFQ